MSAVILESVLTCPNCGFTKQEDMPTDACQFFYECGSCKTLLRPNPGDCCVFCSFGTVKCPPFQEEQHGCCGTAEMRLGSDYKTRGDSRLNRNFAKPWSAPYWRAVICYLRPLYSGGRVSAYCDSPPAVVVVVFKY